MPEFESQKNKIGEDARAFLGREHRLFVGGEWRNAVSGDRHDIIDPSTGERIGEFAAGGAEDAAAAVEAAREAFDSGVWAGMAPAQRARHLWAVADLIDRHTDELADLEAIDGGKLVGPARGGEVPAAAEAFRYHAGWCTKLDGRTFRPSIPGLDLEGVTRLEPIGVAGLITPWNGALVMAAWKLAPALAAGCTVVLKPAENTVLSTLRLAELMTEAGVPAGAVNIVTGGGATVGAALAADPRVDKISFTGSTRTARSLLDGAKSNLKKLSLELGGKSPVVIFTDADIDEAIAGAADAIFSNAGQVCVAGSRIIVHESVFDRVTEGLVKRAQAIRVGAALDPASEMGPLISSAHRNSVSAIVERGLADGASLLAGGSAKDGAGFFYEPTVMVDRNAKSAVWREEIFGPAATLASFRDEDEALAMANDTEYGLAASVWTRDASQAQRMSRAIRAGIVWINCHGIPDMAMPIGGYKQSGWGREHGWRGVEAYLEHKSIMQRVFPA